MQALMTILAGMAIYFGCMALLAAPFLGLAWGTPYEWVDEAWLTIDAIVSLCLGIEAEHKEMERLLGAVETYTGSMWRLHATAQKGGAQ